MTRWIFQLKLPFFYFSLPPLVDTIHVTTFHWYDSLNNKKKKILQQSQWYGNFFPQFCIKGQMLGWGQILGLSTYAFSALRFSQKPFFPASFVQKMF